MCTKASHFAVLACTYIPLAASLAIPSIADAAQVSDDACSLFTTSQVSTALGVSVNEDQHGALSSSIVCGWSPAGGPQIGGKKLTTSLMSEHAFEVGKTPVQGIPKAPLGGVGDDAYYITTGGFGTALSLKKGSVYVQIRVGGFPPDKANEVEKALALQLVSKL
jgi:hypothetical protein